MILGTQLFDPRIELSFAHSPNVMPTCAGILVAPVWQKRRQRDAAMLKYHL